MHEWSRRWKARVSLCCTLALALALSACSLGAPSSLPIGQGAGRALGPTPVSGQPHSPAKGDTYQARLLATARSHLSHMTLDEKLGQMFLVETTSQTFTPDVDTMIRSLHAGALIIYAPNMRTPDQLHTLISDVQTHATIPLLISMDE